MRITVLRTLVLLLALAIPVSVVSAADASLDRIVEAINKAGGSPKSAPTTVTAIARAVALAPDALRAEQAQVALPWGDVFVSHRIAARGGHPLEKVFAARKSGASWKEIADDAKVDGAALEQDLIAAFPDLAAIAPRPAASPGKPAADAPAKKSGVGQRIRDLIGGEPSGDATKDSETKRKEDEQRDFMRGGRR
jgi:hypothetical protein